MKPEPGDLTLAVARRLELDWQYVEHIDPSDQLRIVAVREAGRAAGRLLGVQVVTGETDPAAREDEKVVVYVAVTSTSDPQDQERLDQRIRLFADTVAELPAHRGWPGEGLSVPDGPAQT
ncbi:hypothetical protein Lfu02_15250 [Longispora fulva]|uniref:Uncharacterized protein n=1 Tax=Longispora fulva TaxID=619741 RepID=A0A8J7GVQ8_9ACTN|nr:hypothetical protein [Longispora fulva]MBG6140465.1 hypothetical protein [Longispora fulva]GIG57153.1 hypothetical protein Lfu02_15250 [Longispora fulva]